MTEDANGPSRPTTTVKVAQAKGRPMLSWVGKRPLREVRAYPAQLVERFDADGEASRSVDWTDWPDRFDRGGLIFHGDNKEVLAHLLANGFPGKVDLVYIDPPFDSGADYVRRVQLRGASGTARLDGETYTLGEQIQYTDGRFGTRSWSTSRSTTATSPWRPSSRPRRRPRSISSCASPVPGPSRPWRDAVLLSILRSVPSGSRPSSAWPHSWNRCSVRPDPGRATQEAMIVQMSVARRSEVTLQLREKGHLLVWQQMRPAR